MTELLIHDSLAGKKRPFEPIVSGEVSMYVCGVTVYSDCHIGHARAYVVFDTIRRVLEGHGYKVKYVQNFTDIDDKIIQRAQTENRPWTAITEAYMAAYFEDMDALNIQRATLYPKATQSIPDIIECIDQLIQKGYAYLADGDVFFEVSKNPNYGKLSKKKMDELEVGKRVEVNPAKKSPFDFVLWKAVKPGEPYWPSPWGDGRPGWHIECSAMVQKTFSGPIDIHGGGEDLMFPHHENEICQSECLTGHPLAHYWIHNGFVTIRDEKMSKSLGNIVNVKALRQSFSGNVIRFYLLRTHYRHPCHFSEKGLIEAQVSLGKIMTTIQTKTKKTGEITEPLVDLWAKFETALANDFNFPEAIGYLFEITKIVNTESSGADLLKRALSILGIIPEPVESTESAESEALDPKVEALIAERELARKAKDFQKADQIRNELLTTYQIQLKDTPNGVTWQAISH